MTISKFISAISKQSPEINGQEDIKTIIINGLKSKIVNAVESELQTTAAYDVINQQFIPALDEVGRKFEKGEFFLPQLMASAEAVKAGFDIIKKRSAADIKHDKGTIVLATVKGDVHDIGKNIVKMLLENYGYDVIDLGKDVDPQIIVDAVLKNNVKVVGLSALMTTTVKNMAITIKALRDAGSDCKVIVGGAVLNNEYAAMVGADFYAKDAAETVKIASTIFAK